jgi:SAM-dependent methyltransferase
LERRDDDTVEDVRLAQTWENVWRTDDIEAAHLDAVAQHASANTQIFRPYVDRMLQANPDPTLLEAGSGLGQWLYYVLERSGGKVIGLDLAAKTQERVRHSQTLALHDANGRLSLITGDMRAMPLADASVDLIFSFGVIEHVVSRDSQKTVDEFKRVLKPGGRLLLATPNLWSMHTLTRPVLQLLRKWTVGFERSISPARLATYCVNAGLRVEERGVMESGCLFGAGLSSVFPVLEGLSRRIERFQKTFGFMAYVVAVRDAR